ncbi:MAG: lasso peptide biosynthesis B2 protein [Casimicrobiaceae bacterium]
MSALSTARSLTFGQWVILLRAALLLPAVDVSLRLRGCAATRHTFVSHCASVSGEVDLAAARDIARAVSIAARCVPWPATCLRQAVVLERFLARRGIPCAVRIGVSSDADLLAGREHRDRVAAHAWVEVAGQIILGGEQSAQRYVPLL